MFKFTDDVVGTVNGNMNITENDVESIIVGAYVVGSDYWMAFADLAEQFSAKPDRCSECTWAVKLLLEGKDVNFYDFNADWYEGQPDVHKLTLPILLKGIEQNCRERPGHCLVESMGVADYDCIMQYALFGKLRYKPL